MSNCKTNKNRKKYVNKTFKMKGGLRLNPFKKTDEQIQNIKDKNQSNKAVKAGMKVLIASLYDTVQSSHDDLIKNNNSPTTTDYENTPLGAFIKSDEPPIDDEFSKFFQDDEKDTDDLEKEKLSVYRGFDELLNNLIKRQKGMISNLSGSFFTKSKKKGLDFALYKKIKKFLIIFLKKESITKNHKVIKNIIKNSVNEIFEILKLKVKDLSPDIIQLFLKDEIQPVPETTPSEEATQSEETTLSEETTQSEETTPIEETTPSEETTPPVVKATPIEETTPSEETPPPVVKAIPVVEDTPTSGTPLKGGEPSTEVIKQRRETKFDLIYNALLDYIKKPETMKTLNVDLIRFGEDDIAFTPNIKDTLIKIMGQENKDKVKFRYTEMYRDFIDRDGNFLIGDKFKKVEDSLDKLSQDVNPGTKLRIPLDGKNKELFDQQMNSANNNMKNIPLGTDPRLLKEHGMYQSLIDGAHKISVASLVRSLETLVYAATNQKSRELSNGNMKLAFQHLQKKLITMQSFIDDPRGKAAIANSLEQIVAISDIIIEQVKGPIFTVGGKVLEISSDAGFKIMSKGMKIMSNMIKIIPILGQGYAIAENFITLANIATQTGTSFLQASQVITNGMKTYNPTEKMNDIVDKAYTFKHSYDRFLNAFQEDSVGGMIDALTDEAVRAIKEDDTTSSGEKTKITGGGQKKHSLKKKRKRKSVPSRKRKNNKLVINKRRKIKRKLHKTRKH